MLKGIPFILFGLLLDAFQIILLLTFAGVTAVAGLALNIIPVIGTAASVGSPLVGALLGDVVDIALSFGFGTLLITLLGYSGMFYPGAILGTSIVEVVLPFLPAWTLLALRSTYNKYKVEKTTQTSNA